MRSTLAQVQAHFLLSGTGNRQAGLRQRHFGCLRITQIRQEDPFPLSSAVFGLLHIEDALGKALFKNPGTNLEEQLASA